MILYLDTSALVKLYVRERGTAAVGRSVREARHVATSRVSYPEAQSALARCARQRSLGLEGLRRAVSALETDMGSLVVVELDEGISRRAGELAERHGLRGFDAIHVASAIELGRMISSPVAFLTFDARQAGAAEREGLLAVGI